MVINTLRSISTAIFVCSLSSLTFAGNLVHDTLANGTSIRAASMGFSFTAIAEENAAFSYNPAGFAVPGGSFRTDNYDYNGDVSQGFGGNFLYIHPFGFGKWRRNNNGEAVDVSAYGYGRRGRGVDFGILYKSVERSGNTNQNGWSSDVGAIFRVTSFMDVGVAGLNVFKKNVDISPSFRGGISLFDSDRNFRLTSDAVLDQGGGGDEAHVSVGCEYLLTDGVVVRGGWKERTMTGGLSLTLPFVEAEYAFISDRSSSETYHMLGFKFGRGTQSTVDRRQYSLFKQKTFAEFTVASNVVEGKSEYSLLNGAKIGANDLMTLIRDAAMDSDCEGYIVHIGDLSGSLWGISMIQEIRSELQSAKANGKKIIVYIDGWASLPEYYLASVADKIVMPEIGAVGYLGIKFDVVKTRYLLNNFGVNYTVIQSGKYKTALYPVSPTMDSSERALMEDIVYSMYREVVTQIKNSRKIDWTRVSDVFDGHMITAREAKEIGLIDQLAYPTEMGEIASTVVNGKAVTQLALSEFSRDSGMDTFIIPPNRIAVVEIDGEITSGREDHDYLFGRKATGAANIEATLESIQRDSSIKGLVLRVNSPGGSVLGSDRIFSAIQRFKEKGIPVYVSMGSIAASGGFYVSLAGDKIYANPSTLTGSIGVVSLHPNYSELNSMLDIRREVITTGKYMDSLDSNSVVTSEDVKMATDFQHKFYKSFTEKVKMSRHLSDSEVEQVAQGQVILGEEAQRLKIVDEMGTFYDVVDALAKKSNITHPQLVFYRADRSLWSTFIDQSVETSKVLLGL
ncbi:signal peptide peptidase SppA [bacterium]|nr:signal peptide peptidase SppA [bacterium]